MPDAKGATGAGSYPALAADANLEAAAFPIVMVVQGRKAMPAFGPMLTDQQIADVVNYMEWASEDMPHSFRVEGDEVIVLS